MDVTRFGFSSQVFGFLIIIPHTHKLFCSQTERERKTLAGDGSREKDGVGGTFSFRFFLPIKLPLGELRYLLLLLLPARMALSFLYPYRHHRASNAWEETIVGLQSFLRKQASKRASSLVNVYSY